MFVLSRQEMREIDQYTIHTEGIPGKTLMETAGLGCAKYIQNRLSQDAKLFIFCGTGNNGGDGFVIARYLHQWGHHPRVFVLGDVAASTPETRGNYRQCKELGIPLERVDSLDAWFGLDAASITPDVVVDAIFGNGFSGVVRGWRGDMIEVINDLGGLIFSVDIPSGVDADTGEAVCAIHADVTLTMAAPKYGHLLGEGRAKTGKLEIIDIGVPPRVYRALPPRGMHSTTDSIRFPQRSSLAHKGDFGRIGIIAGSPGFSGAAVLASRAALRAGGGLITLFHPAGMDTIFEIKLTEVMTCAIPFAAENRYDIAAIEEKLNTMDVLLFGPGVGVSEQSLQMLEYLLASWHKPLIIDADGLNLLSTHSNLLGQLAGKSILLTPHLGEFARLATCSLMAVREQTIARLTAFTRAHGVAVLLKSATTILAAGEELWFDTTGNDALATGGSGDVLSGIITSFVGQKLSVQEAAVAASWLLGTTAEKLCNTRGSASVIPSDIIEALFCV